MNYQRQKYDLSSFAGQTVRVRFESTKGAATPMLFFLDAVGLTYKPLGLAP